MNPALRSRRSYPMAEIQRLKEERRASGATLYDFGVGDPIEPTPQCIREALINAVPEVSQYPSVAGPEFLREAVSNYAKRRFHCDLDAKKHIIPSNGSKEAIFHLPLVFLDPESGKDTVIYGTPGYPVYEAGTLFAHGKCHAVALQAENNFKLELGNIDKNILKRTAIVWLNYPHNPTGACVDLAWLDQQAEICRTYDIILACDECYVDNWFSHSKPPVSQLQNNFENCLIFQSCSKRSGMTGYRSGFIAGDEKLITDYKKWRAAIGVATPDFVNAAAAAAWTDENHVAERRSCFDEKYQILREGLSHLGIKVFPSEAGLYCWARIPENCPSSEEYAKECLEKGIIISPGSFLGEGGEGFFRIALVPDIPTIQAALAVWPKADN